MPLSSERQDPFDPIKARIEKIPYYYYHHHYAIIIVIASIVRYLFNHFSYHAITREKETEKESGGSLLSLLNSSIKDNMVSKQSRQSASL